MLEWELSSRDAITTRTSVFIFAQVICNDALVYFISFEDQPILFDKIGIYTVVD